MSLKISRVLHAGYIFEYGQSRIIFDPIFENPFSRNCFAFPDVQFKVESIKALSFDAVFISHYHDDHCSLDSLNLIHRNTPIYMYCVHERIVDLIKALGFKTVSIVQLNHAIEIKKFKVTPRRALDAEIDCLFHIQTAEHNVLNVVDSWIDWETIDLLKNQKPWDLILWPFQTMRELEVLSPHRYGLFKPEVPTEWIEQLQILNPTAVIASSCQFIHESWSWYNQAFFPISYRFFQEQLQRDFPEMKVLRLDPGQSLKLQNRKLQAAESLPWIVPVGPQDVDYQFDQQLKIPPTAEIAKHFPALNYEQKQVVESFLEKDIQKRFEQLEPIEEDSFSSPRIWELRVFDSTGEIKKKFYKIKKNNLHKLDSETEGTLKVDGVTEIAESKIYSALVDGESLTSLYVRVENDAIMDPLVRCLFNKNPLSYQEAQLKRILKTTGVE